MLKKFFPVHSLVILLTITVILNFSFVGCQSNSINGEESEVSTHKVNHNKLSRELEELWVNPQITDEKIDDWLEPHYVVTDKSIKPNNKLFVFLSGSFGIPQRQQLITQQAAKLGYHAVNLRYPNSWTVSSLCKREKNLDCYGNIRREILTGVDESPLIDVNQANSLENRLVKLLLYLGWQQYVSGNVPKWESIVIAGHSQGGGEAFFIAKQNLVAKAIAFAAPVDYNRRGKSPANWLVESSKTPPERYYGFVHFQDRGFKKIRQAWKLLQLDKFGDFVNVDKQNPPYNNSHQLVTSVTPRVAGKYHGAVVVDKPTPLSDNGNPLFIQVWTYLLKLPR